MTREAAERVHALLLECSTAINRSIAVVQASADDSEFRAYRAAAGRLMANVMEDLLRPLYREYPDLVPPELGPDFLGRQ
jgi:hypothetical protein